MYFEKRASTLCMIDKVRGRGKGTRPACNTFSSVLNVEYYAQLNESVTHTNAPPVKIETKNKYE